MNNHQELFINFERKVKVTLTNIVKNKYKSMISNLYYTTIGQGYPLSILNQYLEYYTRQLNEELNYILELYVEMVLKIYPKKITKKKKKIIIDYVKNHITNFGRILEYEIEDYIIKYKFQGFPQGGLERIRSNTRAITADSLIKIELFEININHYNQTKEGFLKRHSKVGYIASIIVTIILSVILNFEKIWNYFMK